MNKSIMMGRLVRDPEIRYSQGDEGELAIANLRLAVDRKRRNDSEQKADFFKCTAFGRLAEFAEEYLHQGIKVIVTGRLQNDNYTNRDGDKVYGTCLMLDEIEFAESKAASQRKEETDEDESDMKSGNKASSRRQSSSKGRNDTARNSSSRGNTGRSDRNSGSRGKRGETRNSSERNRRNDLDEDYSNMDEYEEDYNFN